MPQLLDRISTEREFHDRQAADRALSFSSGRADLRFDDDAYLDHESWIRPAFGMLGDLRGKAVLDFGCGHGMAAVVLARQGADVTAFDLSPGYVEEARMRAATNGVTVRFTVADGEALPFADGSFDAVWGNAVLHHLDMDQAGQELRRVLRPGGVAVFCEPWDGNPLLRFARQRLPYPGKHRTADEVPLRPQDVERLRCYFPDIRTKPFQFFEMLRRVMGPRGTRPLRDIDHHLLKWVPAMGNWCRYLVLTLPR